MIQVYVGILKSVLASFVTCVKFKLKHIKLLLVGWKLIVCLYSVYTYTHTVVLTMHVYVFIKYNFLGLAHAVAICFWLST